VHACLVDAAIVSPLPVARLGARDVARVVGSGPPYGPPEFGDASLLLVAVYKNVAPPLTYVWFPTCGWHTCGAAVHLDIAHRMNMDLNLYAWADGDRIAPLADIAGPQHPRAESSRDDLLSPDDACGLLPLDRTQSARNAEAGFTALYTAKRVPPSPLR